MESNRFRLLFSLAVSTMILLPLSGCTSSSTECKPDAQARVPQDCSSGGSHYYGSGGSSGGSSYRGGSSGSEGETGVSGRSSGRGGFGSFGGGHGSG